MMLAFQIVVLIGFMISILGMVGDNRSEREFYIKASAVFGLIFLTTIAIERVALT